ncbi:T9SS type A sorting domain-containing protein [Sabulilitoribacter multivorans]|uniref:T9SS type A sorting domain-containing protein n=1 Tax=Flaviramulus multivorans TaxID=1304750 RepID=A0ABS9ILA3_9FLAO|nr:T9SS type A sorting domain-containing protein [Flaviramulus multivorans]MCF7561381.1 T9SS type A sorting domain-containing protein [Flaviramulus multivorans]
MKTKLLTLFFLGIMSISAQTTHNLNWQIGMGTNVDLTIDVGDTVIWTWTDNFAHTVTSLAGSAENFNSGSITGNGMTYSKVFTVEGSNPYECSFHPLSMAGTITVQNSLSINDFQTKGFSISPNPAKSFININLPINVLIDEVKIFNLLGKQVYFSSILEEEMDVTSLPNGLYFISISSEGILKTKKIIKQ